MDPYLARLIGREDEEQPMLLKKYFKGYRVFIRIKGILPLEQCEMLRIEMEQIREQYELRERIGKPAVPQKRDVPVGGAS